MKKLILTLCLFIPVFTHSAEPKKINFNEYSNQVKELASVRPTKMHFPVNSDDWQAVSAVAATVGTITTLLAVLVALVPIFSASAARRAKARNLRMRLVVKLFRLQRTFIAMGARSRSIEVPDLALLSNDAIERIFDNLELLLAKSDVLKPHEQDRISQVVANLELALPILRAGKFPTTSADSIIALINEAIKVLEKGQILAGTPHQPWKSESGSS